LALSCLFFFSSCRHFVICVQIFVTCLTETQCSVSYLVLYVVMFPMLAHFQLDYVTNVTIFPY